MGSSSKRTIRKELKGRECLVNISCLNDFELTSGELLQKVVSYLPAGFQYPEIAEATIEYNGMTYQTVDFVETDWTITSVRSASSSNPLSITVAYRQEVRSDEEDPFLFEERQLLDSVAAIVDQKIVHNRYINELYDLWDKAYDLAGIGYWSFDIVNNELYWSSAIRNLHEVPDDYEPDLESAINFYQEGTHRETVARAVENTIATGESFDVELKIITAKGNSRWIHAVGQSEFQDGQCIRVYGSTQDITEQKLAEKELIAQKERLERSQRIANIGDWEFIPDTKQISWSTMTYEIFDLDPKLDPPGYEEILSRHFPESRQLLEEKIENAVKKAEPYDLVLKLRTGKGIKKFIRSIGYPVTDDSGKVVKILGTGQDITDKQKMEMALHESEQRLEAAVNGADLGVWDLNLKTGDNYTNDRWWEMLGYEPAEMKYSYESFLSLLHPEDREKPTETIERIHAGHSEKFDITIRLRGKDGQYRTIQDRGKVVEYDEKGSIVRMIGTHMDISEKVELMDKVVRSAIEGEDRERKRIARDLHDGIGQYLAASNMNFESLKHEIESLSPKSRGRFNNGLDLLKQAMDETRKTARKLMPEVLEEYGLTFAVESLIQSFQKSSGTNISFTSTVKDATLHKQSAINLYRIIQEALNNAIIHGKCSNITIDLRQKGGNIVATIKDDGFGVNIEDTDFEKGLGLRNIKFRVQSMSGTIDFDSQPQKGMTITLKIPINKNVKQNHEPN